LTNLPSYSFIHKGCRKEIDGRQTEIYTFKSDIINQHYIVELIKLDYDIYVIQFFLKNHRLSENRFNLLLPKGKGSNKHVFYLLNTITKIAVEIIEQNPNASFGFMGAATSRENNKKKNAENINPDSTIRNTKRYRVYSKYVLRYFPPNVFTHIEYKNSSCYLLKNNRNQLSYEFLDEYLNFLIENKISI
jgi:hypothetical protein